MLHKTSLIVLVGLHEFENFSPRKITLWSSNKNDVLQTLSFPSEILVTKINKVRLIVSVVNYLHIYSTGDMKVLHIYKISNIYLGKLILSVNSERNVWVCFESSDEEGVVKTFDALYPSTIRIQIKAHKSPILKLSLNKYGDRLATCSCKGTIIRIFSLPKGEKICTFKRGINPAFIFCLSFSNDGDKLISTSENGMLHIFDIGEELEKSDDEKEKGFGKILFRSLMTVASKLLPEEFHDSFGLKEASITYHSNKLQIVNLASFSDEQNKEIFCISSDGNLFSFSVDYINKNIVKKYEKNMKEFRFIENNIQAAPSVFGDSL